MERQFAADGGGRSSLSLARSANGVVSTGYVLAFEEVTIEDRSFAVRFVAGENSSRDLADRGGGADGRTARSIPVIQGDVGSTVIPTPAAETLALVITEHRAAERGGVIRLRLMLSTLRGRARATAPPPHRRAMAKRCPLGSVHATTHERMRARPPRRERLGPGAGPGPRRLPRAQRPPRDQAEPTAYGRVRCRSPFRHRPKT